METNAMKQIAELLNEATTNNDPANDSSESRSCGQLLLDLFHEYEERSSLEAKTVKDLDLLDMILQADEYESEYSDEVDLQDFFTRTPPPRFQTPIGQVLAQEVHNQRQKRQSSEGTTRTTSSRDLSERDAAFVRDHARVSGLNVDAISEIVRSLRQYEAK